MVGRLQAGGRVAAAALLALGSMAPLNGPLPAASVAPLADTSAACAVTVGTATTDPTLAADAVRAMAVGYAATDCLPDASLLAAAEARAAIPMGSSTTTAAATPTAASSPLGGSRSSGPVAVAPPPSTTPTAEAPATSDTTTDTPTTTETTTTGDESSSDRSDSGTSPDDSEEPSGTQNGADDPDPAAVDGTTTAAGKLGWGTATGVEDFDGDLETNWSLYDGEGHAGNGLRSPSAMSVSGGVVTITGDANGTTGGMAWKQGRSQYGRWEARVKSPVADPSYNAVMLLWPDAENWPVGGEVDFMEIGDETRQEVDFFLHYGEDNSQLHDQVAIDATQWHNWAVEWSPTQITGYVDGEPWFSTTQASALPPGPMHLTLQLDWFPKGGSVQQSTMDVDWVRYYPIDGSGAPDPIVNSLGGSAGNSVTLAPNTGTTGGTDTDGTNTDGTGDGAATDDDADDSQDELVEPTATETSPAGATSSATTTVTEPDRTSGDGTSPEDGVDAAPILTEIEGDANGADANGADGTASTGADGAGSTAGTG
jgi:hypothetical protein